MTRWRTAMHAAGAFLALALVTAVLRFVFPGANATTVALAYLLVVLFVASLANLGVAAAASLGALLAFNYFFLPPVGTLTIAELENWVALGAFLIVSIVASHLSASARARAREALDRRNELTRLFDVTRDILLTTEGEGAIAAVALHVARRFELDIVAICLPSPDGGWQRHHGGSVTPDLGDEPLDRAFAATRGVLEFDARTRSYGGQRLHQTDGHTVTLVPIRLGTRAIGLLAVGGRPLEPGTLDAIGGIVAIAVERSQFLAERHTAELAHARADLSSALLASIGHDLRTPLTAIRLAVANISDHGASADQRTDQAQLALAQIDHLARLFEEILDMARIEAGSVRTERQWVTPADVVEAALAHVGQGLAGHDVRVDADGSTAAEIDPRLTSAALGHLLENAARYSPPGSAIDVRGWTDADGLYVSVSDEGPGLDPQELERLFEPFFRGQRVRGQVQGTGMGLAITRGLLAAEGGRVWGENLSSAGARFTITIPAPLRAVAFERGQE